MNTTTTPIFVPEKPQQRERRNYIALELLKAAASSSQEDVSVEWCFKKADEFLLREAQ